MASPLRMRDADACNARLASAVCRGMKEGGYTTTQVGAWA